ncbi:hypothetical protein KEM52_003386, partial [Ascosphaera acerosa]
EGDVEGAGEDDAHVGRVVRVDQAGDLVEERGDAAVDGLVGLGLRHVDQAPDVPQAEVDGEDGGCAALRDRAVGQAGRAVALGGQEGVDLRGEVGERLGRHEVGVAGGFQGAVVDYRDGGFRALRVPLKSAVVL